MSDSLEHLESKLAFIALACRKELRKLDAIELKSDDTIAWQKCLNEVIDFVGKDAIECSKMLRQAELMVADNKRLRAREKELKEEIWFAIANNNEKNKQLAALHNVFCDGGCASGVHYYDGEGPETITQDIVDLAVRNTVRLLRWWRTRNYTKTQFDVLTKLTGDQKILVDYNRLRDLERESKWLRDEYWQNGRGLQLLALEFRPRLGVIGKIKSWIRPIILRFIAKK
jgi:hypothetical protein